MSLLRLGICRPEDWSGSAVDFVERGYKRLCQQNGADEAHQVWVGDLRIADYIFELSPRERDEAEAEMEGSKSLLYLVGDYEAAASIPIGPTLVHLGREHDLLPATFYGVFNTNLWKWMRVYDFEAAKAHAEMWSDGMDEEELQKDSPYLRLDTEVPACISKQSRKLRYRGALQSLEQLAAKGTSSTAKQLIEHVIEMDAQGRGQKHAWPCRLNEKQAPGLESWLADAEDSRPGCLITWYEDDAINACFDEEAEHMGENGPCQPNVLLAMNLAEPAAAIDRQVRAVFDHVAAMLRSLAAAAKAVEIIREIYDEHICEHRLKPGLQT
jgi:hypothetical protein